MSANIPAGAIEPKRWTHPAVVCFAIGLASAVALGRLATAADSQTILLVVLAGVPMLAAFPGYLAARAAPSKAGLFIVGALLAVAALGPYTLIPYLLVGGLFFFSDLRRWGQSSGTHGSARWATEPEVRRSMATGLFLGHVVAPGRTEGRVTTTPIYAPHHILAIAPTRAGKGRNHLIPALLTHAEESFVVLDVKGELAAVTARFRRQLGHETWVWDPHALSTGCDRCTIDLLRAIDPASPDAIADAMDLATALVSEIGGKPSEAHWIESARQLLVGLLLHAAATRQSELAIVREWTGGGNLPAVLMEMTTSTISAVRRAANTQLARDEREGASVLSTLARNLTWLDDPRLAAATGPGPSIGGRDLRDRPLTLYLSVPPDRLENAARPIRAVMWLMLRDLTRHQQGRKVVFVLDELAQLGRLEVLEKAIAIASGYRVQLWMLVQSLSQLRAAYDRHAGTLIANSTLVAWSLADHETAKMLSDAIGQTTVQTVSTGSNTSYSGPVPQHSTSTTYGEAARALITADELRQLGPGRAVVFERGLRPIVAQLPDYLSPGWAGRADPNPMHG